MPRICYTPKTFKAESRTNIDHANTIIAEYEAQGFSLTLRQLYYQFVSRGLLPNTQQSYKNLGSLINDARYAGLIDWNALEDRTRNLRTIATWDSPRSIISACAAQFKSDWWDGQPFYVEAWIEKDALIGVLEASCERLQVPYFSCRGYTSASEIWGAAQRIGRQIHWADKRVLLLHLGDHDPSGIDMSRDIEDRLRHFLERDIGGKVPDWSERFEVRRIALNMAQVQNYNPPPNPAKLTDSRATAYIEKFGDESWELDALTPTTIDELIQEHVLSVIDDAKWQAAKSNQVRSRVHLETIHQAFDAITADIDSGRYAASQGA